MDGKPPEGFYQKKTRRQIVLSAFGVFFIVIGLATFLAFHTSQSPQAKTAVVYITNKGFQPGTLVVHQGTKVVWTNNDQSLHQVASNPFPSDDGLPSLKSEILNNTQTYQFTANKIGSFSYHDDLQPTLNGTIVVEKK